MSALNLKALPKSMSPAERFEASYIPEPNSGCWLWLGAECGSNNYGRINAHRESFPAHRYAWLTHRGEIPDGLFVLHHCDNSACVNPDHLFLGTNQDNSDDKVRKGRQAKGATLAHKRASGERNGMSKLTRGQAASIRLDPRPQRAIAGMYGVSQMVIWQIKNGRTWND